MVSTINFIFHQQRARTRGKATGLTRQQIKRNAAALAATYGLPQPQSAEFWAGWKILWPAHRAGIVLPQA